jgi:hypothetical protein
VLDVAAPEVLPPGIDCGEGEDPKGMPCAKATFVIIRNAAALNSQCLVIWGSPCEDFMSGDPGKLWRDLHIGTQASICNQYLHSA